MKLILRIVWWLPGKTLYKWACKKRAELVNKEQADKASHLRDIAIDMEKAFIEQGKQYTRS